jgi:hypothetical protein
MLETGRGSSRQPLYTLRTSGNDTRLTLAVLPHCWDERTFARAPEGHRMTRRRLSYCRDEAMQPSEWPSAPPGDEDPRSPPWPFPCPPSYLRGGSRMESRSGWYPPWHGHKGPQHDRHQVLTAHRLLEPRHALKLTREIRAWGIPRIDDERDGASAEVLCQFCRRGTVKLTRG